MQGKSNLRRSVRLTGVLLMTLGFTSCATWQPQQRLQSPFSVPAAQAREREAEPVRHEKNVKCKAPPAPVYNLHYQSIYSKSSPNASVIDPEAYETYKDAVKPLNRFESELAGMANRYVTGGPRSSANAVCVMNWLDVWAQEDALNGEANRTGVFVRKWVLGSIASAYLQVRDEPSLDALQDERVREWMRRIAGNVVRDFQSDDPNPGAHNNHLYWAAWGVMAAGIALDDREFYVWGLERARIGIAAIAPDGTLALEMARGRKALNYHSYAAIPLFAMAEAAARNGADLYGLNDNGLFRLARRMLAGLDDPSYFNEKSGETQDLSMTLSSSNLVWLEPYYARTRDPDALALLETYRPMRQSRIGGNVTLLYGGIR